MKILAISILVSFPFIGALLLAWIGPKRTLAAHYRDARQRTAALAAVADQQHERVLAAGLRVKESARRLSGDGA